MKKITSICCVALALALVACGEPPNEQPGGAARDAQQVRQLPADALRVKKAKIVDPSGFEQPMTAATLMIPVDWSTQGGVIWQQNMSGCGLNTPHVNWTAVSPDGLSVIQVLPEESWSGNNLQTGGMGQSACPNVTTIDMQQFALNYTQRHRPGAEIVDYRQRADLIEEAQKFLPAQQPAASGMKIRQWVDAGETSLAYRVDDQPVREIVAVLAVFTLTQMSDGWGGVSEFLNIVTVPGYAYRAPEHEFDPNRAEMIRQSYQADLQWQARMAQHNAQIARINAKGAADRSRIIAQYGDDIREMQADSWRQYNESTDRNSREFAEYIRGVETYDDPYNGGTVQLDNTYEHAWQLNDGTFVLTNDHSFNPNEYLGLDGNRLTPTE